MATVNYQGKRLNQEVVINFDDCIIENTICLRFPHLWEQINELLDDESLTKCKEVSRIMCSVTKNQESGRFFTKRVIQSYIKNSREYEEEWKIVLNKLGVNRLKEFEVLVRGFYRGLDKSRREYQWSPLHIAAERGHLDFCKCIAKFSTIKCSKWSPLHFSVQNGWLEVSRFLYKEIKDKQPIRIFHGVQHLAAKNGHLDIYRFLHESLNDINPIMQEQITPLHFAAQYGHFDVCKYICDNTVLVQPLRSDGNTPLTLAVHRGHIKITRLLHRRNYPISRTLAIITFLVLIISLILDFYELIYDSSLIHPFLGSFWFYVIIAVEIFCFLFVSTIIVWEIVNDIRFCLWTSPKLDYY